MPANFVARLRARQPSVGYWVASDNPPATERIALAGYDYVCLDLQHGLMDYAGALRGLLAVQSTGTTGVVRVPVNEPSWICKALDAGAHAVVVPLVDTVEQAEAAASAMRYPPVGTRSFGPVRASLRVGPATAEANESVALIVMIETPQALENVEKIAAVPGVDAVYVGPSDLAITLTKGGSSPAETWKTPEFAAALSRVRAAAASAGIASGMHCNDGAVGASALADGFNFVSISNDLSHISVFAKNELDKARAT